MSTDMASSGNEDTSTRYFTASRDGGSLVLDVRFVLTAAQVKALLYGGERSRSELGTDEDVLKSVAAPLSAALDIFLMDVEESAEADRSCNFVIPHRPDLDPHEIREFWAFCDIRTFQFVSALPTAG